MTKLFVTSMARHAKFTESDIRISALPRDAWDDGHFVICEVIGVPNKLYRVEIESGRRPSVIPGDRVLGVLGQRAAALEFVGDWRSCGNDGVMHCLAAAGLFGKLTSQSQLISRPMAVKYVGHAVAPDGAAIALADTVPSEPPENLKIPTVQIVGTSMSAGKTTTARLIVRALVEAGLKVAGAKMIGAGGQKDALTYQDAGAFFVRDFVDVGLPSTATDRTKVRVALQSLLGAVQRSGADVLVAELGAAPHDPYHGDIALELLEQATIAQVLVAGDAYAAYGFTKALSRMPDIVTGQAAVTEAARHATRALLPDVRVLDALCADGKQAIAEEIVNRTCDGKAVSP